jgi:PAS domain S-box-containing protein
MNRLAELIPVPVFRTDAAGRCVHANARLCRLAGMKRDEIVGDGWLRALHPEDRQRIASEWEAVVSRGEEFISEFRFQAPDGAVKVVSARALPIYDEHGVLNGYLGAAADETQCRRTEATLTELTQALNERVKELHCLFGISDIVEREHGSLDTILQATAELLPPSWEHSEVACARIVLNGREFRTDNYAESDWKQVAPIVVDGEEAGFVEVAYLESRPPCDEGPFIKEERNLIDAVAERLGHVVERLRTQQLLLDRETELRERLTHLTRVGVMGEMASSIAHEVNQPLTAIATFAQACGRLVDAGMVDAPEVQHVLTRIGEEALRAGGIIHRLKDLVRKRGTKRVECDINALVRDVEELASVDSRLHDVQLRLDLASSLPPILADDVQIQQVLLNLVRNGVDAMEHVTGGNREIVVRTVAHRGSEIEVSVTDRGCGLPENAEEVVFQSFFTTKETGMGIGLSVSRSIVTSHGGRLWFSRNPEGGTTFFFTIPTISSNGHDTD